jgi:hypothetical protein
MRATGILADLIAKAMQREVIQCMREGVTDPTTIRNRMMAARAIILANFNPGLYGPQ